MAGGPTGSSSQNGLIDTTNVAAGQCRAMLAILRREAGQRVIGRVGDA
jgi:hypothetical protein